MGRSTPPSRLTSAAASLPGGTTTSVNAVSPQTPESCPPFPVCTSHGAGASPPPSLLWGRPCESRQPSAATGIASYHHARARYFLAAKTGATKLQPSAGGQP